MKNIIIIAVVFGVLCLGIFVAFSSNSKKQDNVSTTEVASPTETVVGGDRDEHGCIPSAGYHWCEVKQKCLREWEEKCEVTATPTVDETQIIQTEIKQQLVAKHGPNAESLSVSVSKISGMYAQGGASEPGVGGGMWFAAKVNGVWKLVWDGNGIITCADLAGYPQFPSSMIPECYNEDTQSIIKR